MVILQYIYFSVANVWSLYCKRSKIIIWIDISVQLPIICERYNRKLLLIFTEYFHKKISIIF